MRLFSAFETKSKTEKNAEVAKTQMIKIAEQNTRALEELNKVRQAILKETEEKKKKIEEELAPLLREKEEALRTLASVEQRRKEMWQPFKLERKNMLQREGSVVSKEEELEKREKAIEQKESHIDKRTEDAEAFLKQNRHAQVELRRRNKQAQTLVDLQAETLRTIETEKEALIQARKSFEEKESALAVRENKLRIDRDAKEKFYKDKEDELRKMERKVADDRAKLKSAIEIAKKSYGVRET